MDAEVAKLYNLLHALRGEVETIKNIVETSGSERVKGEVEHFTKEFDKLNDRVTAIEKEVRKPLSEKTSDVAYLKSVFLSKSLSTIGSGVATGVALDGDRLVVTFDKPITMEDVKEYIRSIGVTDKERLETAMNILRGEMMPRRISYSKGHDRANDDEVVKNITLDDGTGELFVTFVHK